MKKYKVVAGSAVAAVVTGGLAILVIIVCAFLGAMGLGIAGEYVSERAFDEIAK